MKLRSTFLIAFAALGTLVSCNTEDSVTPAPVAVDKTVTYEVFAHKDYSISYYADHQATIRLSIKRGDMETMAETVVFDTTFTRVLKDVPMEMDQLIIRKRIPDVVTGNEWISVGSGYSVGQEVYFSSEFLPEEKQELKVEVEL